MTTFTAEPTHQKTTNFDFMLPNVSTLKTYAKAKELGFRWAPKQDLFVAPMWHPQREDFLIELCGEIGDENKSLVERQEERAERFEGYQENRLKDAEGRT